jgi:DNA primase
MEPLSGASDAALLPRVLAHYDVAAPLIERSLAGTPIVYRNYPDGVDRDGAFHVTPIPLFANKLLWLIHAKYAIEFYTWAPLPDDDDRLRFARILLESPPGVIYEQLKRAAQMMRSFLRDTAKLEAVPVLDGGSGIALWIPLADAPHAGPLREWLHVLVNRAAALYPDLVSTEYNTHHDGRVHLHVSSNAVGHYSVVPYSVRAQGLTLCTPVHWNELGDVGGADAFHVDDLPARLRDHGDIFAHEFTRLAEQRLVSLDDFIMRGTPEPRGHIITAAIEILDDGKPRTAKELLADALARKLVPPNTSWHYVYTALIEYIARQLGRGRKPPIVQDNLRRFRINEPLDDWPDLVTLPQPAPDAAARALCDRLETTSSGDDPAAFEAAVCDAFAHLGFLTQHLGAHGQPDGVADAILGPLGYRVLLECKTAKKIVTQPDALEAAKFRDAYKADRATLIGPAFSDEIELLQELQMHRVTALAVPELQTLLHIGANPLEVQRVLEPGYASDLIADLLWARRHGAGKRVATVAYLIAREGWKAQRTAASQDGAANAPQLNVDAAMLLVDTALRAEGSNQACTRAEVEEAFAWLASPNVTLAVRDDSAIVILSLPKDALSS